MTAGNWMFTTLINFHRGHYTDAMGIYRDAPIYFASGSS